MMSEVWLRMKVTMMYDDVTYGKRIWHTINDI